MTRGPKARVALMSDTNYLYHGKNTNCTNNFRPFSKKLSKAFSHNWHICKFYILCISTGRSPMTAVKFDTLDQSHHAYRSRDTNNTTYPTTENCKQKIIVIYLIIENYFNL